MPYPSFLPDIQRWSCETRRLRWLVLGSCLLSMTGCGGCRRTTFSEDGASKDEIAKKSQPLPRLDVTSLQALPASGSDGLAMKPGHWYELQQSARANETDEALMVSCSAIGRAIPYRSLPMLDPGTTLSFERDIRLARGQRKLLAMELFYPGMHAALGEAEAFGNASIRVAYRPRFIGAAVREESYPVAAMPDYQFNLVVLSQNPDRYRFLGGLSCVNWPSQVNIDDERIRPFRVVQVAQAEAQSSLPHRMMAWTSTSHLLWNDCAASTLLASQQQSLVDWLHFGGQLIINGPESQAALKDSFLSTYLPLTNLKAGQLDPARWQEFSRYWSVAASGDEARQEIVLPADREPPLMDGELTAGSRWVDHADGMVAERYVGSGRIVMTTFSLGESIMVHWPSYSSFFNAAALHRPSRIWRVSPTTNGGDLEFAGAQNGLERDPMYVSRVRLMSRDLGRSVPRWHSETGAGASTIAAPKANEPQADDGDESDAAPRDADRSSIRNQAVAQIESDSAFGKVATEALQESSGIQVPRILTIIQLLAGYFFVLVPLNWAVFRMLGRVELAWLAAPIIAIMGAVIVARSVQLDIGFSRSQMTISLLELKSGYHRGHLTSYLSLYSSLSTNYSARYPNSESLILPVTTSTQRTATPRSDENRIRYEYASEAGVGFAALPVRSNSTRIIRGEEMQKLDEGIAIAWGEADANSICFQNRSPIGLQDVGVVGRSVDGRLRRAWIGRLDRDTRGQVGLETRSTTSEMAKSTTTPRSVIFEGWAELSRSSKASGSDWNWRPASASSIDWRPGTRLNTIASTHVLEPGDAILLGWTSDPLSRLEIIPKAIQQSERTLVAVCLHGWDPSPLAPDASLPQVIATDEVEEIARFETLNLSTFFTPQER